MPDKARHSHPEALPNHHKAKIPEGKFARYLLDPLHRKGRHKARVFKSVLGFEQSHWEELEKAILSELPYHPAVLASEGQWGTKYEVTMPIIGVNGATAQVLTIWIILEDTDSPQFVTARVSTERRR